MMWIADVISEIINDDQSKYIVVAAAPGSCKTRVLVHKLASLLLLGDVVKSAVEMINNGDVEPAKIMKSVLVIDEAQNMDENEFALIQALIRSNDYMRVIAVVDDDQNIYEFRGSDSKYMRSLLDDYGAVKYDMEENFRSKGRIVALGNAFVSSLNDRMKSSPTLRSRRSALFPSNLRV